MRIGGAVVVIAVQAQVEKTIDAIALVTDVAFAGKRANGIHTSGYVIAVVAHTVAFIDISAALTVVFVASPTWSSNLSIF